jgi:hypothetical protein
MGGGQPLAALPVGADQLGHRRAGGVGRAGLALHQLHHQEHALGGLEDVVDRHDVRVREPRQGAALVAGEGAGGVVAGRRQLERDAAVELGIPRRPHHAHAAGAGPLDQAIPSDLDRDHVAEQRGGRLGLGQRALERIGDRRPERGRGRTRVVIDLGADDHVVVGMRGRLVTVDGRPESARFAVTDVAARHAWAEAPGDVAIGTGRVLLWNPSVHAMPEEP